MVAKDEDRPSTPRRALVLAGGGAKGAYQFGVLKALSEASIEFHAVSGTSAGALNAVLFACDELDAGERIWRNLSFSSVYPITILDPNSTPKMIIWIVGVFRVIASLTYASITGKPVPSEYKFVHTIGALVASIPILVAAVAVGLSPDLALRAMLFLLCFWIGYVVVARHVFSQSRSFSNFIVIGSCPALILVFGIHCLVAPSLSSMGANGGLAIIASLLSVFLGFVLLPIALTLFLGWQIARFVEQFGPRTRVMSAEPLRLTIEGILRSSQPKIPCFATYASKHDVFDPDDPEWNTTYTGSFPPSPFLLRNAGWFPNTSQRWIPQYLEISKLSERMQSDCLLASAALPYGIVAPITSPTGEQLVDGGVADNVPFYPFVSTADFDESIDEIWVVILDHCDSLRLAELEANVTPERWAELRRTLELANYPVPTTGNHAHTKNWKKSDPPQVVPFREPSAFPQVKIIYPTRRSLGGFLDGTLRFDKDYARECIDDGHHDARQFLEKNGYSLARASNAS